VSVAFASGTGWVAEFDERRGIGRVTTDDTGASWFFHCTRIADGRRTIPVGVAVSFDVEPGPMGLEAVAISPQG
jgi:cold shock CspA family protein